MGSNPGLFALVTGSGKRLGREMAIYLAGRGFHVALHYNHSKAEVKQLLAYLEDTHPDQKFITVQKDLEDWTTSSELLSLLPNEFGPINLLINNASVFEHAQIMETECDLLQRQFSVNFFTPFVLTRSFATKVKAGHVVNIVDTKIATNETTHAAYLLSKKALGELTRMAALELAPAFRINAIAPGPVLPATGSNDSHFQKVVEQTPLRERVLVESILSALGFLMDNPNVTGQIIYVDSGSHLKGGST
jgi:NAD(P)-dependent dehydrogenase (short-subunit alcohol dehydrogenase family)